MWHFGGALAAETPTVSGRPWFTGAAIGQRTTNAFAVGFEYKVLDASATKALIFKYER
jgi:hypothetical protein